MKRGRTATVVGCLEFRCTWCFTRRLVRGIRDISGPQATHTASEELPSSNCQGTFSASVSTPGAMGDGRIFGQLLGISSAAPGSQSGMGDGYTLQIKSRHQPRCE